MRDSLSLRARIIILVLAVAMLPLGLIGWWLTRTAARSGEELLRLRLDEGLERAIADFGPRWVTQRSALVSLGELDDVQRALSAPGDRPVSPPAVVVRAFEALDPAIASVEVRDDSGGVLWSLARETAVPIDDALGATPLPVRLDIFERGAAKRIGMLVARLSTAVILTPRVNSPLAGAAVITVVDPATGASLVATPFDPANLRSRQFEWAGGPWLSERRSLAEPRLDLVAAAPLDPFTQPFEVAARHGLWVLIAAAAAGLLLAAAITARMTRRLRRLASAADAVAHGDLSRKTEVTGTDEVARVAQAFNTMTESLEHTLGELSRRESLVAVGAFASELAHEVRNPLTAIRIDLQIVEERLPMGSPLRDIQRGALDEIQQLDATVSGVLQLARSGRIEPRRVDLGDVVRAASHAAQPEFDRRGAVLQVDPAAAPVIVWGDPGALRQMLLNLLLNAAQALGADGRAVVAHRIVGEQVVVSIRDDGEGVSAELLAKIREPFISTKPGGTGLGLAIADRIAQAHGGLMEIESIPGVGTEVRVSLSRGGAPNR